MFLKQDMNVIITVVTRGFADKVMESAKSAGAEGATIFNARGNGIHESDTILGVSIQPEKEVVLIVVRKNIRKKVMRAICVDCGMNEEGRGLCFSLPIEEIGGVNHWIELAGNKKKVATKTAPQSAVNSKQNETNKTTTQSEKTVEKSDAKKSQENTGKIEKNSEEKSEIQSKKKDADEN